MIHTPDSASPWESDYYEKVHCRLCDSRDLEKVVELTPTPAGNHLLTEEDLDSPQPRYPLCLSFCRSCHHIQLSHVVDPRILYQKNYTYVSATSPVFVTHLRDYAEEIVDRYDLQAGSLVADIGSNDGTCLRFFAEAGFDILGVDPATEVARRASEEGIPTVNDFFGEGLARRLKDAHGSPALITSHNALAHIDDLRDVMRGVCHWLADDGIFVFEVGYFLDVFRNTWFDTIYHEHVDYHTVEPLVPFLETVGMEMLEVERVAPQGGSIRVICQKRGGGRPVDSSVQEVVDLEAREGLDDPETIRGFGERINAVKDKLSGMLDDLRREGARLAGYGAPTKATTLISHFDLDGDLLDFIVDDNPLKQGLFLPVAGTAIVPAQRLYEERPDYVLILAWNFADPIMEMHERYAREGGRFIVPMPEPRIVS